MPLYEYECDACGERFELIQKYTDPSPDVCTRCGKGPVQRLASSPAIQFKGSGWYITDYARKGKTDSGAAGSTNGDKSEKKTETRTETKTETKTETGTTSSSTPSSTTSKPAGSGSTDKS